MVKKLSRMVILLCIVVTPAWAQYESSGLGFKGGLNFANIAIDPEPDDGFETYLRFGGGLSMMFSVNPNLAFDLDALYMMKGAKREYRSGNDLEDNTITYKTELDYITLSPMLRIIPMPGGGGPYILAGAEFGYLVRAKAKSDAGSTENSNETDIKDDLKDIDIGINLGGGMQFPLGDEGKSFFVEAHYVHGLQEINEDPSEDELRVLGEDYTWKNRAFYVFAGIRL